MAFLSIGIIGKVAVSASVAFAVLSSVAIVSSDLQIFDNMAPGSWELHTLIAMPTKRKICLEDPMVMIQIYHPQKQCSRHIITNETDLLRVYYSCPMAGSGRTTIRRETDRLVQIHTEAIVGDTLNKAQIEARHVGHC